MDFNHLLCHHPVYVISTIYNVCYTICPLKKLSLLLGCLLLSVFFVGGCVLKMYLKISALCLTVWEWERKIESCQWGNSVWKLEEWKQWEARHILERCNGENKILLKIQKVLRILEQSMETNPCTSVCTKYFCTQFQILYGSCNTHSRLFKMHKGNNFYWMGCNTGTFNIPSGLVQRSKYSRKWCNCIFKE